MEPARRPPLPADHALFARDDWFIVRKKARAIAYRRRPSLADAEDLAHDAILRCVSDPKEPWRRTHKRLVGWLALRIRRAAGHMLAREERFPHLPAAEEGDDDELDDGTSYGPGAVLQSKTPGPEEAYLAAEAERRFQRRLDALAEKTAGDALVSILVAAVMRGEPPMDVAASHGFTPAEVYNARKRLERAAQAVLEEERRPPAPSEEGRP